MYTPVNPKFTIQKWVVRGSLLHGHVSMMYRNQNEKKQKLSKAGLQGECTLNHKSKFALTLIVTE